MLRCCGGAYFAYHGLAFRWQLFFILKPYRTGKIVTSFGIKRIMNKHSKNFPLKIQWLLTSLSIAVLLSSCASISKGVAQAILERSENEDTRQCLVWGKPFAGIEADLAKNQDIVCSWDRQSYSGAYHPISGEIG